MKSTVGLLTFAIVHCLLFVRVEMADLEKAFKEHEVIPDAITTAPQSLLKITYPSGVSVNLGNELAPTQVKDQPTLDWEADDNAFYAVLFVDSDAPSRQNPAFREVRHWSVVNIPGKNVNNGEAIVDFIGSGPPKDTGLHRYIFLVFKQKNGKVTVNEPHTSKKSRKNRFNTKVADFVKTYDLGELVAGNFYQAQYDDYVPLLHAQLSEE